MKYWLKNRFHGLPGSAAWSSIPPHSRAWASIATTDAAPSVTALAENDRSHFRVRVGR